MSGVIAWFARNGVAANLLMVAILFGGVWALRKPIATDVRDQQGPFIDHLDETRQPSFGRSIAVTLRIARRQNCERCILDEGPHVGLQVILHFVHGELVGTTQGIPQSVDTAQLLIHRQGPLF